MSLAKRIIPCLDVKNGRVVKGIKFKNLKDAGDPVESACAYSEEGADEIVYLDITASIEDHSAILDIVRRTAEEVFIPFTVGGGIKDIEDIRVLLKHGADKVSINTAAVKNPDIIKEASEEFGSQCIVVAIDAKLAMRHALCDLRKNAQRTTHRAKRKWEVYIYGGTKPTGIDAVEWAKKAEILGAGEILLTSMDKDGTKESYDLKLTRAISGSVNIPVIASGGAGNLEHLYQAISIGEADAVLAASIFHYGEYSINQAKEYLKHKGISVREQ